MFALRGLEPDVRQLAECAVQVANSVGIEPVITSTRRSWAEQTVLRHRWEAGLSAFPANRPGDSAHEYGLAWDSWVPDDQMARWKLIRECVGFRVPEGDLIHAERPNWRSSITQRSA